MALRNGLLVHGPDHWAVALRTKDGRLRVESGPKPRIRGAVADLPGIRGIARLGEAFALLPRDQAPRARGAVALRGREGAGRDGRLVAADRRRAAPGRPHAPATSCCSPRSAWCRRRFALRDSQLAAYHGVEHKAIAGYEQDTDAALVAKEHDRCGSNLVAPMILSTVVGNLLVRSVLGLRGPVASTAVTLAGVAVSVELFAWSERHQRHRARPRLSQARIRDAAPVRHPRADHGAARGGARGADRDHPLRSALSASGQS